MPASSGSICPQFTGEPESLGLRKIGFRLALFALALLGAAAEEVRLGEARFDADRLRKVSNRLLAIALGGKNQTAAEMRLDTIVIKSDGLGAIGNRYGELWSPSDRRW